MAADFSGIEVPLLGRTTYGGGGRGAITPENEGHWRAAARRVFTVPTCDDCATQRWPVSPVCWSCYSMQWSWQSAAATGIVYTYTWIEQPEPAQNVAVIELDTARGTSLRVPGRIIGVSREELTCGMRVEAGYDIVADGIGVPFWHRAPDAADR